MKTCLRRTGSGGKRGAGKNEEEEDIQSGKGR